jgi:peptidoglycan/xylan/chitin deacetylase (PgdA/CDA1 family)
MKHIMIHDIRKEYFDLDLNRYRLTFDDALFSQYYYFPLLKSHPQKLTYFITTSFIKPGKARKMFDGSYIPYLKAKKYGYRTFIERKYDHFMNVAEIQKISKKPNVRIGVHSHFHDVVLTRQHARKRKPLSRWKAERFADFSKIAGRDFSIRSRLAFQGFELNRGLLNRRSPVEWEDYVKYDTELCITWVEQNLGFTPDLYCFPFNEHNQQLISILKSFGFKEFFAARPGKSREVKGRVDVDSLVDS